VIIAAIKDRLIVQPDTNIIIALIAKKPQIHDRIAYAAVTPSRGL